MNAKEKKKVLYKALRAAMQQWHDCAQKDRWDSAHYWDGRLSGLSFSLGVLEGSPKVHDFMRRALKKIMAKKRGR